MTSLSKRNERALERVLESLKDRGERMPSVDVLERATELFDDDERACRFEGYIVEYEVAGKTTVYVVQLWFAKIGRRRHELVGTQCSCPSQGTCYHEIVAMVRESRR